MPYQKILNISLLLSLKRIVLSCLFINGIIPCFANNGVIKSGEPTTLCNLSFPQSASPGINTIYIPFTLVGRLIIVQARIDSMEGNFIVDTGSERLLLNKDYIRVHASSNSVAALGNTGNVSGKEKHIDSLNIDQLAVRNLLAHIVDLNHIEDKKNTKIMGILGYNVFQNFEVLFDFQNSRIVLSKVDKKGVRLDSIAFYERPYDSVSFELKKHFIVLDAFVNGIKLEVILDSGAELNLIDRKVNKKVLEKFTIIKRINLLGVGKKQVEVLAGTLEDVKCGNQESKSMNTLLTSMDEINTSFGVNVQGVLGYEFLGKRRTLINYQKRKLYFFGPLRS